MAKLSADKTYVTVEKGDTLPQIAVDYAGGYSQYKTLAAINNISNPDLIYVGQKIYLTKEAASGSGSASSSSNSLKAVVQHFGLQSNSKNTLFAMWSWNKPDNETDSYKISWEYLTENGVWFSGNSSSVSVDSDNPSSSRQSTYSIPSNAKTVRFKVKPISKTYKKNDVDTTYWTASWSSYSTYNVEDYFPLTTPDAPSIEIDKFKLTATLNNIDIDGATHIEFKVFSITRGASKVFATKKAEIVNSRASYAFSISAGSEYQVRCRAYQSTPERYSDWSKYTDLKGTIPSTPTKIKRIEAMSSTSVQIWWDEVTNADGYVIEYTTDKLYFDTSVNVSSVTINEKKTTALIPGLDDGNRYFFRLKASSTKNGDSGWSTISSIVIGEKPAAPTTWSSTTTAILGNPVTLYWVHNSSDESNQTYSELQLHIEGLEIPSFTLSQDKSISNQYITYKPLSQEDLEAGKASSCILHTSIYDEGTSIKWEVRTAGVTRELGDWSVQRIINVYAPATLELDVTDAPNGNTIETLTSFPFYISGLAGPKTQTPIGYHVSVKSNDQYETIDNIGNTKLVNSGEEIYSKYFDISDPMLIKMTPSVIDLENNCSYTVTCIVSMDTGLTAEQSMQFTVDWTDEQYIPNAEIGIDDETITASIRPYCENSRMVYYQVVFKSGLYKKTTTELSSVWGKPMTRAVTTTGERVYSGVSDDGNDVYYCVVEEKTPVEGVLLSVYRREFDGSFTEIATELESEKSITVTDPHPALDYARYRIVAVTKSTGAVSYYDPPGYPVKGNAVIIQWDEDWSSFETSEESAMEQPAWFGSMLKLPYNIDVSDDHNPDISLIEYAGRSHPVSYYGTQLGSSSKWSLVIPKEDKETLYGLRRLARWMGDVYVREPSGSGYWASIKVSFSQKHCEVTIPVTLSISQVEGGV